MCVIVPIFVKIGPMVAEVSRFYGFLKMADSRHPPSWIRWARTWTTRDEYLVVSIIVHNLVAIDAVVLTICDFQYFARLNAYLRPKMRVWGVKVGGNRTFL